MRVSGKSGRRGPAGAFRADLRWGTLLLGAALVFGCDSPPEDVPNIEPPEVEESTFPALAPAPGYPLIDDALLRRAPERYSHAIPRLVPPTGIRYRNLRYEANNVAMRGARNENGLYESTGQNIAERWRVGAAGVKSVFAVRDALFSQQDHPIDHDPVAVMMPPNWITVAVQGAIDGQLPDPMQVPPLDDDEAWAALRTPEALFGGFPASERLHEVATQRRSVIAQERLRVTNARRSVHMLHLAAQQMLDAAPQGPEAVARAGAEAIADSDERYFGRRLRREKIIVVTVEHPTVHERIDEGKGFRVRGREISDEAVVMVRQALYRRRLAAGDLALQRYNLSRDEDRARAIALLEALIPERGDNQAPVDGGVVWLWVNGGQEGRGRRRRQRDATPFIGGFRQQVTAANVDMNRVRFFSEPHVPIGGLHLALKFDTAARRFSGFSLPLSLNIGSALTGRLMEENERRRRRGWRPQQ